MSKNSLAVLRNVLIPKQDNLVQAADIYFGESIGKIQPHSSGLFNLNDISTKAVQEKLKPKKENGSKGVKQYEGDFNLLIPGAIDAHVHFDTPGFEFREDFQHGSAAAASGGTTTVADMPCTSIPAVTSQENLSSKLKALKDKSCVDYALFGGISANEFTSRKEVENNLKNLASAGVIGIKVYTISTMQSFPELDYSQIKVIAEIMAKMDIPLLVHAEDSEMVGFREKRARRFGQNDWQAFARSRDAQAEAEAVLQLIKIAKETKCRIHVVHLSSELALMHIRTAQANNINISAETCPHYLFFTKDDFKKKKISKYLKTTPPVKENFDKEALWNGLNDGTINFITTDHAGCDPAKEKISRNFWEVYSGIPGVEHRVPFLISEGVLKNKINFELAVNLLSKNPAEFYKLKNKGILQKGYDSDFALIDIKDSFTVKSENMNSKGKYSPFEDQKFDCVVKKSFVRGVEVFSKDRKQNDNLKHGKFVSK